MLVDQIADKSGVIEVDTFGDTRAKVEFEVLVDTLGNRIEEGKNEALVYAIVKVEADAVVNTPPDRRSVKGQAKVLVYTLTARLTDRGSRDFANIAEME